MLLILLMSKGSKEALTVLLITFLIFNGFSIHKKFWKAETQTFPTIPSNAMYIKRVESYFDFRPLQHVSTYIAFPTIPSNAMYVERVESYFDFWPLRHVSTYIALDGMVEKVWVSAFQNFLRIENPLNITN